MTADLLASTAHELDIALARESRPRVRKRLLAVKRVLGGVPRAKAARLEKVGLTSIYRWVGTARRLGCAALVHDGCDLPRKRRMSVIATASARAEIAVLLKRLRDPRARRRLIVVDKILAGGPVDAAAREARAAKTTVKLWLARVQDEGVKALLGVKPGPRR